MKMNFLGWSAFAAVVVALTASCNNGPSGEKAQTGEAQQVQATGGGWAIDPAASVLEWEGTKPTGKHTGNIKISAGDIKVENGAVTGGSFTIDMASVSVTDLEPGKGKEKLEGHLKSGDFFDVEKFATAKFEITSVKPLTGVAEGEPNTEVTGNLTIRDVTKSVTFKAYVKVDGDKVTASAPQFVINRMEWGIKYHSKEDKTFDQSQWKDNLIGDNMGIKFSVVASKS